MFSKPLDPQLKAYLTQNLTVDPANNVRRVIREIHSQLAAHNTDYIKDVMRIIKFIIKDKVRAKPKYYSLVILKEIMKSRDKQIVEYFIKKLLSRLSVIAAFEIKNPDPNRGTRCLKNYYSGKDDQNAEFSLQFFILLLECWKNWDQMYSKDYPKIREKCEKLRKIYPQNEIYYNDLEDLERTPGQGQTRQSTTSTGGGNAAGLLSVETPGQYGEIETRQSQYQSETLPDRVMASHSDTSLPPMQQRLSASADPYSAALDRSQQVKKYVTAMVRNNKPEVVVKNLGTIQGQLNTLITDLKKLHLNSQSIGNSDFDRAYKLQKEINLVGDMQTIFTGIASGRLSADDAKIRLNRLETEDQLVNKSLQSLPNYSGFVTDRKDEPLPPIDFYPDVPLQTDRRFEYSEAMPSAEQFKSKDSEKQFDVFKSQPADPIRRLNQPFYTGAIVEESEEEEQESRVGGNSGYQKNATAADALSNFDLKSTKDFNPKRGSRLTNSQRFIGGDAYENEQLDPTQSQERRKPETIQSMPINHSSKRSMFVKGSSEMNQLLTEADIERQSFDMHRKNTMPAIGRAINNPPLNENEFPDIDEIYLPNDQQPDPANEVSKRKSGRKWLNSSQGQGVFGSKAMGTIVEEQSDFIEESKRSRSQFYDSKQARQSGRFELGNRRNPDAASQKDEGGVVQSDMGGHPGDERINSASFNVGEQFGGKGTDLREFGQQNIRNSKKRPSSMFVPNHNSYVSQPPSRPPTFPQIDTSDQLSEQGFNNRISQYSRSNVEFKQNNSEFFEKPKPTSNRQLPHNNSVDNLRPVMQSLNQLKPNLTIDTDLKRQSPWNQTGELVVPHSARGRLNEQNNDQFDFNLEGTHASNSRQENMPFPQNRSDFNSNPRSQGKFITEDDNLSTPYESENQLKAHQMQSASSNQKQQQRPNPNFAHGEVFSPEDSSPEQPNVNPPESVFRRTSKRLKTQPELRFPEIALDGPADQQPPKATPRSPHARSQELSRKNSQYSKTERDKPLKMQNLQIINNQSVSVERHENSHFGKSLNHSVELDRLDVRKGGKSDEDKARSVLSKHSKDYEMDHKRLIEIVDIPIKSPRQTANTPPFPREFEPVYQPEEETLEPKNDYLVSFKDHDNQLFYDPYSGQQLGKSEPTKSQKQTPLEIFDFKAPNFERMKTVDESVSPQNDFKIGSPFGSSPIHKIEDQERLGDDEEPIIKIEKLDEMVQMDRQSGKYHRNKTNMDAIDEEREKEMVNLRVCNDHLRDQIDLLQTRLIDKQRVVTGLKSAMERSGTTERKPEELPIEDQARLAEARLIDRKNQLLSMQNDMLRKANKEIKKTKVKKIGTKSERDTLMKNLNTELCDYVETLRTELGEIIRRHPTTKGSGNRPAQKHQGTRQKVQAGDRSAERTVSGSVDFGNRGNRQYEKIFA